MLDTFNAANNLPDVLFALISGGALAMAFIPLMSDYLTLGDAPRMGLVLARPILLSS
jgi:peptidoglycan biosynthesis protein MviN/MurJ (putative lipid II flippase)